LVARDSIPKLVHVMMWISRSTNTEGGITDSHRS